ncbi:YjfB family protein [Undibacterium sp.]|uniref:YjfB family protein n=1 Tax=Undibacterium sp. TaxID=1914977 RepID=UPI00374C965C
MATTMADVGTSQAVGIAVLKKALDATSESAMALIEAIPDSPTASNLRSHLGRNINTTA